MRLRLGLAALFALVATVPLTLAVQWHRDTTAAIVREALEERADRVADAERARIEALLAATAREAERACDGLVGAWRARGARLEARVRCQDGTERPVSVALAGLGARGADAPRLEVGGGETPEGDGVRRRVMTFPATTGDPVHASIRVAPVPLAARAQEQTEIRLQIVAIAAIALALLLGWIVGGRVQRSLAALEQAAQRIGKGDLEVRVAAPRGTAGSTFSAFNRMAHELQEAKERAKRAERVAAWRDIARRIAHEIKNPLTPIRMSIETMRRTKQRQHPDFDEIFEESTRTVLEEVERLERIVTEFSRFARLPRPSPSVLDVREVATQVVQLHSPGGDATITDTSPRMPIKLVLASELPKVRADRDQLTQVLVNLVQNAIDAAQSKRGDQGHVEVEVDATPEGLVRVTVSDDGPGIPEDERARILEPYYTTKAGGTGLGLSIVDRIVSEHGGSLSIGESRRGGAAISITLTRDGPPSEPEASQTS